MCPVCGQPDARDRCPRCGTDLKALGGEAGEARLEVSPVSNPRRKGSPAPR